MPNFEVRAYFSVTIDIPGDPESDEYQEAVEEIERNLEGSHALLTTSYDTHHQDDIEVERLLW